MTRLRFIHPLLQPMAQAIGRLPLQAVLIIPFAIQVVGTAGVVGVLAFWGGHQAVSNLAAQLMAEESDRMSDALQDEFNMLDQFNQSAAKVIEAGLIQQTDRSTLETYFTNQMQVFPSIEWVAIASGAETPLFFSKSLPNSSTVYGVAPPSRHAIRYRLQPTDTPPFNDPSHYYSQIQQWVQQVKASGQTLSVPLLSTRSEQGQPTLSLATFTPIKTATGTVQGVLVASLDSSSFTKTLQRLRLGDKGQALIIDRNGYLIASSTGEAPLQPTSKLSADIPDRSQPEANNSEELIIQTITAWVHQELQDSSNPDLIASSSIKVQGQTFLVKLASFRYADDIDWLIVLTAPKSSFTTQIRQNTDTAILFCLSALLISLFVGGLTARWITRPLLQLIRASQAIAQGTFELPIPTERQDEVGDLARAFSSMALQLQQSFRRLENLNQALTDNETRLVQILEALPVGVSVHRLDGSAAYFNQTAKTLLQIDVVPIVTIEQLSSAYHLYQANTHYTYPVDELPLVQALQGSFSVKDDIEVRRNGQSICLEVRAIPVFDELQQMDYVVIAFQDITQRKQVETILKDYNRELEAEIIFRTNALRESEERFREIAETINQVFFVRSATTGEFLYISPGYSKIWGRSCQSLYEDARAWEAAIHPEDYEQVTRSVQQQFEGHSQYREYRILRPDGEQRWISAQVLVIQDSEGIPLRFVGIAEDITDRKEAEAALRQSEQQNRLILSAIPDLMVLLSIEGTYISVVNSNGLDGLPTHLNPVGKPLSDFLPTEVAERHIQQVKTAIATGEVQVYEQEVYLGGRVRYEEVRIVPNSEHTALMMIRDISQRKRTEAALRKSEERWQLAIQGNNDGIWDQDLLTNSHFLSPRCMEILGYDYEEIDTFEKWSQFIHPDDQDIVKHTFQQHLNRAVANYSCEYRIRHKDGTYKWVLVRGQALWDETRRPIRAVGSITDISDRKRAEAELKAQQEFLKQIINIVPSSIFVKDKEGRFVIVNEACATIYKTAPEQLLGKRDIDFNHDLEQIQQFINSNQEVMATLQQKRNLDEAIQDLEGNTHWYQTIISPFIDSDGQVNGIIGNSIDITERKQIEQELKQAKEAAEVASQAKSQFLAHMSHELRTPLNAILGFSQLLSYSDTISEQDQNYLRIINRSGEHLLELINDVLEMSKIEAAKVQLNMSSFNLHQLLNTIEELLNLKASAKQLTLTIGCDANVPQFIQTDQSKLRQILINILSNAIKFTQKGWVSLWVHHSPFHSTDVSTPFNSRCLLQFDIEDTGSGIAPDDLQQLFKPFLQTQVGQQTPEGTGLGLAISRSYVQLLGGEIRVRSSVGQGSRFSVTLPVVAIAASDSTLPSTQPIVVGLDAQPLIYRILVVDDQWTSCQLMMQQLAPIGFDVKAAKTGRDAIAIWQQWQPHLILMDMLMPAMDSYRTTRQIKADQKSKTVIIAVTDPVSEVNQAFMRQAGCDDLFYKPFTDQALLAKIAEHLPISYRYSTNLKPLSFSNEESIAPPTLSLNGMPTEWVNQLRQSAEICGYSDLIQLINDIPDSHTELRRVLQEWVDEFRFDQILALTEASHD